MQIKSLYMPDSIIQNDEFPAHITWDKNDQVEITLTLPKTITIKEVYNVPENISNKIDEFSTKFNQFEVNGYVGFVFKTQFLDESKSIEDVQFIIKDLKSSKTKRYTKKIQLFRPSLELLEVPSTITIEGEDVNSLKIDNKIRIKNNGNGTALISVKVISEGGIEKTVPYEIDDFYSKVIQTIGDEFENLKLEYSEYTHIIDDYYFLLNQPISLDKDIKEKIVSVESELFSIFERQEDFLDKFLMCIWHSYIKNIQVITKIESFVNYLNSIGKNKIILLNSIELLKCFQTKSEIKFLIQITDLNYNDYPSIETPSIIMSCKNNLSVPIFSLFEWNGKSTTGE